MRIFILLALTLPVMFAATTAQADADRQTRFHQAFVRMDAQWPNISAHDYWLALKDAEDTARSFTPEELRENSEVAKELQVFEVYRRCWVALHAKEKALSELLVGELIRLDTPENGQAAREHFALAVASWDEAFRLWPYMRGEKVRGDALASNGEVKRNGLVGPGSARRAEAQKRLSELTAQ